MSRRDDERAEKKMAVDFCLHFVVLLLQKPETFPFDNTHSLERWTNSTLACG